LRPMKLRLPRLIQSMVNYPAPGSKNRNVPTQQ
jgi:hypothetical protein